MRNSFLLAFFTLLLSCNCESEPTGPNACTSNDPINQIEWLVDLKNSITNCSCQVSILKGTYKKFKTVYFVLMNDPLCNGGGPIILYDCYGETVTTIQSSEVNEHVTIETSLYSCKD